MRTTHHRQMSLPIPSVPHKHARLLASMSAILDSVPELEEQVLSDLTADGVRLDLGRDGFSAQQVLRLMVLYTMFRTTFEQLEFHLADSQTVSYTHLDVYKRQDLTFEGNIRTALSACIDGDNAGLADSYEQAVARAAAIPLTEVRAIGTGYGRQRLPFPKDMIRSEILCHGLGANISFPGTATVLDIGGQDTKAIQVDARGIVTSFQMNDRCAAGCGRYLGYIADEMNLGVHELGPVSYTHLDVYKRQMSGSPVTR